ncbi:MAG: ABC transporter permease, partial [Ruminococcus sp.]|nr:ABC transporter permease [Ruminococcus sp.]
MRTVAFASRNTKEILRDPLTLIFGLGFPLVLLVLLSAINAGIPKEANNTMFTIQNLAPGISVFGLSFLALFSSMLISKDRTTSFVLRLFTSPIKPADFILGYTLPMLPMALVQSAICYAAALFYGLPLSPDLLLATVVNLPIAVVFIALGLLFGALLNEKAVGGVCGALLTNLSAWFSNIWFDTSMVGGWFKTVADAPLRTNAERRSVQMWGVKLLSPLRNSSINKKNEFLLQEDIDQGTISFNIAPCCSPIPGDSVVAFIEDDGTVTIHKKSCPVAGDLASKEGHRIVSAKWSKHFIMSYLARISLEGIDR